MDDHVVSDQNGLSGGSVNDEQGLSDDQEHVVSDEHVLSADQESDHQEHAVSDENDVGVSDIQWNYVNEHQGHVYDEGDSVNERNVVSVNEAHVGLSDYEGDSLNERHVVSDEEGVGASDEAGNEGHGVSDEEMEVDYTAYESCDQVRQNFHDQVEDFFQTAIEKVMKMFDEAVAKLQKN
ncbi:hypothetical protein TSUD_43870 [Trifolium subterraneum]|uniref:Uncharacterized protein n=1 Tax=Trifolium subterraneum TaxID=3900 RepID=A0A2Z6N8T9_TRISU|nr:hypothetical protein TSUD_43870 [Trifolium subterraneum]